LTLPPGAAEYLSGFVVDMLRAYKETNNVRDSLHCTALFKSN
jgi:hypothetical protein